MTRRRKRRLFHFLPDILLSLVLTAALTSLVLTVYPRVSSPAAPELTAPTEPIPTPAADYIANSFSGVFHYRSCEWAAEMDPANMIGYDSAQAAIDDGYRACRVCRPGKE